jgi:hypothetical protein
MHNLIGFLAVWALIGVLAVIVLPGPSKFPENIRKQIAVVEGIISGPIGWAMLVVFAVAFFAKRAH